MKYTPSGYPHPDGVVEKHPDKVCIIIQEHTYFIMNIHNQLE